MIAEVYSLIKQPLLQRKFQKLANNRVVAINMYCWDRGQGFFTDYNFHHSQGTGQLTLAGVFPLYAKIASAEQAASVANIIEKRFLKDGGLITTLMDSSQQWDAPNGWAPLHWIVIESLRNYGFNDLADTIKERWIKTNSMVFKDQHKLVEKYNVTSEDARGGGGEYPLQDGFGWTNGVLRVLLAE